MNRLLVAASALFLSGAVLAQDAVSPPQITQAQQQALGDAVASTSRGITNVMRDAYRNPQHTLAFFGITPGQTVIEVWPGAGWYTEILAPLLRDDGKLITAHFDPDSDVAFFRTSRTDFETKLAEDPQWYDKVELSTLNYDPQVPLAEPESADRVLTFRNVHNWLAAGDDKAALVFDKFYAALKPGGMLGVVEHQARAGTSLEDMIKTGYVTQAKVRELAETAGFEMISISPVNQNVQDTKDHPEGVWTLPPTLRLGDKDRARYLAIGEATA